MLRIKEYVKAASLEEAYELNQKRSNRVLGGMLWMRMSDVQVQKAIDLSGLGLDTIEETDTEFIIGAMVTLRELELHSALNDYFENAIRDAVQDIVGVQFRNLATVGGSVFGRFGKEAERTAQYLLENRLAGCAASDAHRANYRTPDMRPIREFLSEWYGESYAELLLKVNPRRILENRPVLYEPSPERRRKRRWFV